MDGYNKQEEIVQKFFEMQELFDRQIQINKEISEINKEINNLPELPNNMDQWTDSIPDFDTPSFKLSDFRKLFKINKKYNSLLENRDNNSQKIKILVIDNLIDRIKDILDK